MTAALNIGIDPIPRRLPSLGGIPDYSRAFYPDPPSHDFCVWLIIAELMRRHRDCKEPLRVKLGLIRDQLGLVDFGPVSPWSGQAYQCGVSREYYEKMLDGVMRPAMEMLGAVDDGSVAIDSQGWLTPDLKRLVEYDYHISSLVDASRAGYAIPQWTPPAWAFREVDAYLRGAKPVVITLRELDTQPERNSRTVDWLRFANSIDGDHQVLFLRDTSRALENLPPFPVWKRASENAYVRAALYQRAKVNLMVGNGPNVWCIFSDAPYIFFKQLVPALPNWAHGQPQGWRDQDHMEVGEQLPWAKPNQIFAWEDDTFENISRAFAEFPL